MKVFSALERRARALMAERNLSWDDAWFLAKRETGPQSSAANEALPGNAQVTTAGALVKDTWPVPVTVLASLGLPAAASERQYRTWRLGESVNPTKLAPEIVARIIMTACQLAQLQGISFRQIWDTANKDLPDLLKALPSEIRGASDQPTNPTQAANSRPAAQVVAGQAITAAVNERRERFPQEPYETSFAVVKRTRPELFADAVGSV